MLLDEYGSKIGEVSNSWYKWRADRQNQGSSLMFGPEVQFLIFLTHYLDAQSKSLQGVCSEITWDNIITTIWYILTFQSVILQSNNVRWKSRPLSKSIAYSSSALSRDQTTLYMGSYDKSLYAISTQNGSILWRYPTGSYTWFFFCDSNHIESMV